MKNKHCESDEEWPCGKRGTIYSLEFGPKSLTAGYFDYLQLLRVCEFFLVALQLHASVNFEELKNIRSCFCMYVFPVVYQDPAFVYYTFWSK